MNRRRLLSSLTTVSVTTGCLTADSDHTTTTVRSTETEKQNETTEQSMTERTPDPTTPATTEAATPNPAAMSDDVQITGETVSSELAVEFTPTLVSGPTAGSPTTVEIELTNTGAESLEFTFGEPAPFPSTTAAQRNLVLLDANEAGVNPTGERYHVPKTPDGACWRIQHEPSFNALAIPKTLQSGDSVTNTYFLLAGRTLDCPISGQFRFESTPFINESDGSVTEHDLGFTVTFN